MKLIFKHQKFNFAQWIATFAVFLLGVQYGIFTGWTSPNVAQLSSENSPIPTTASEISWMVSLAPLGSALGAILGSTCIEYLGSRRTVLVTYMFMGVSWLCVLCANSMVWLCVARFIGGLAITMFNCGFSMYLSEVSAPKIRGTLISLALIGTVLGVILGLVAETYLEKTISSSLYFLVVLIGILILMYLKDTAYYLVKKKDLENAKKSTIFYRNDVNADKELEEIKQFVQSSNGSFIDKFRQLQRPTIRKSMLIIIIVFGLPDASGLTNILSYTEVILRDAGFDFIKPEECVIYTNVISIASLLLIFKLIDKLGRKISLIISSVGTTLALIALGFHFYLENSGVDVKTLQWLPIGSILVYLISFNFGYISVPGTLLSEMFPENMKSIAVCLGALSTSFFGFVATKSYEPIVNSVGEAYAFWIHALLSILGVPCALFLLTETKGKTFQQIQDELNKNEK